MMTFLMTAASGATEVVQPTMKDMLPSLLLFAVMILAMYFLMIRPQKKREKQQKMMRDALAIGDTVVTIGGIYGIVIGLSEDSIVIETGSDRSRIRVKRWAIQDIAELNTKAKTSEEAPELTDTENPSK